MNNGTNAAAQTLKVELSLDEVNVVLAGLGELPAKASLGVIEKVRGQVYPQLQAQQAAAPEAMPEVAEEVAAAE